MILSDVVAGQDLAMLMFLLTQEEGSSVIINHPNADFDGPTMRVDLEYDGQHRTEFGETAIECLLSGIAVRREQQGDRWLKSPMDHVMVADSDAKDRFEELTGTPLRN
jgi:hypothetical protein